MNTRTLARLAGALYLIVGISGGYAQLVARQGVLVAGDAAATADNIRASSAMFRLGLVADVVNIVAFVVMAMLLYAILSPVRRKVSAAFVVFVVMAATIIGIDLVNHAGALLAATSPELASALGTDAADALAALFLQLHGIGYLVAEVFFGLWLVPAGYVVYRSGFLPRWLGVAMVIGAVGYLASFGLSITAPSFEADLAFAVAMPAAFAELALMGWLLIRGVDDAGPLVAGRAPTPALPEGAGS